MFVLCSCLIYKVVSEFYKKCLWVANLELSEEDLGALTLYPHEEEILQAGRNTS